MFDFASLGLDHVDTIVDVGAGTGAFLKPALEFYKPKQSLAVEILLDRAYSLWREFPATHIVHAAAGERQEWLPIGRTVSADSSSLLVIDPRSQDWFTTAPGGMSQRFCGLVEVRTLDEILSGFVSTVDLLKIDVQGYEGRVLRGAPKTLRRTRALIIEVLAVHHYEGQSTPEEIDRLLTAEGFRFVRWLEQAYNGEMLLQGDAFYVRD